MDLSKIKISICLFGLIVFLFAEKGLAQGEMPDRPVLQDAVPPAPTAASLGKFADIPVSLYSGTPQINIPLHQINSGDVSLDLSLSYHASGVKVEEIASWVGLGWALNAGGVVTRATRGLPDDDPNGFFNTSYSIPLGYNLPEDYQQLEAYATGAHDSQPDLFYFNFAGHSGKIVFDQDENPTIIPYQKMKIRKAHAVTGNINSWEIITEDGTKYTFGQMEETETYNICNKVSGENRKIISSWFLSGIESVRGSVVRFEYERYNLDPYEMPNSETDYTLVGTNQNGGGYIEQDVYCVNYSSLKGKRLKRILFANGEVEFKAGKDRCDLIGDKMLAEILIKDKADAPNVLKKYVFKYGYFSGGSMASEDFKCGNMADTYKRLALLQVQEKDPAENIYKPPYEFSYVLKNSSGQGLPPRIRHSFSGSSGYFAQDHWGFFNGKLQQSTLIPPAFYDHVGRIFYFKGANRYPDESSAKVGTLQKILYPTGGSTGFEYELHDCISDQFPPNVNFKNETISFPRGVMSGGPTSSEPFEINSNNIPDGQKVKGAMVFFKNIHLWLGVTNLDLVSVEEPVKTIFSTSGMTERDLNQEHILFIPNGKYKVNFVSEFPPYVPPYGTNPEGNTAYMSIEIWEVTDDPFKTVGGLRVKRITDFDPVQGQKLVKLYDYKKEDGLTSGSVVSGLDYGYPYKTVNRDISSTTPQSKIHYNYYYVRTAFPNIPLTTTQGSLVGYNHVTVYYGEDPATTEKGLNGKSVYTYFSPLEKPDKNLLTAGMFPFPPADSRDWHRGLLRETVDYKKEGDNYVPVKRNYTEYSLYDATSGRHLSGVLGMKVGFSKRSYTEVESSQLAIIYFTTGSGYSKPKFTTETQYDGAGVPVLTTRTDYEFSTKHLQLTKSSQTVNDGSDKVRKIITERTYPADYSGLESGPLFDMQTDEYHIFNAVVEQLVKEEVGGEQKILSGQIIEYGYFDADNSREKNILPKKVYRLETSKPLSVGELSSSKPSFTINAKYFKPQVVYNFDRLGNLQQQHQVMANKPDEVVNPSSLVWGLNNTAPVAVSTNAPAEKIAYTGFEEGESNLWVLSGTTQAETTERQTGRRSRKFSSGATIKKDMPAHPRKYLVSFWAKAASASGSITINGGASLAVPSGWTYHEQEVNLASGGEIKLSVSGTDLYVDEVRIHPREATMRTFSYNPIGTLNTLTDENGTPTYYQHDPLHRLQNVLDYEENILQSYKYNYQVR